MSVEDPNDLERIDREIRINELKERAKEISGGKMHSSTFENCPPDVEEEFWQRVVEYESAPMTTPLEQLKRLGIEPPPPGELDNATLSKKLNDVIEGLAALRDFLQCTDHLSDRELYTCLWEETLREETPDLPPDEGAYIIDLVGSGSDEDTLTWLRYYADEPTRESWKKQFPDYDLPVRETPPWDRDRRLPKSGLPGLDRPDRDQQEETGADETADAG